MNFIWKQQNWSKRYSSKFEYDKLWAYGVIILWDSRNMGQFYCPMFPESQAGQTKELSHVSCHMKTCLNLLLTNVTISSTITTFAITFKCLFAIAMFATRQRNTWITTHSLPANFTSTIVGGFANAMDTTSIRVVTNGFSTGYQWISLVWICRFSPPSLTDYFSGFSTDVTISPLEKKSNNESEKRASLDVKVPCENPCGLWK